MDNIRKSYVFRFLMGLQLFGAVSVPFLLEWGKLDYTRLFGLEMLFVASLAVFQVPTGAFADRHGRKRSIFLGSALVLLGIVLFVSRPDFLVFAVAEVVWGIGNAFISGADDALVYDTLASSRRSGEAKKVFANMDMASSLGIIVAAPVGSVLAGAMILPYPDNYAVPFALTAVPVAAAMALALLFSEEKRAGAAESVLEGSRKGLRLLSGNGRLLALALDWSVVAALAFFMFWLYQPLLRESGIPLAYWGFVAAGFNLLAIGLLGRIDMIDAKLGPGRVISWSALAIGLGYLALLFTREPLVTLPVIFIITSFNIARGPVFRQLINEEVQAGSRATVMSAASMLRDASRFVLYPIIGHITDISLDLSFLFLGVSVLAVILALWLMRPKK